MKKLLARILHRSANKLDSNDWQHDPITESQIRYIINLCSELTKAQLCAVFYGLKMHMSKDDMMALIIRRNSTKGKASNLIDILKNHIKELNS